MVIKQKQQGLPQLLLATAQKRKALMILHLVVMQPQPVVVAIILQWVTGLQRVVLVRTLQLVRMVRQPTQQVQMVVLLRLVVVKRLEVMARLRLVIRIRPMVMAR